MASKTFTTTAFSICPTENDINGGASGYGIVPQELTFGYLLRSLVCGQGYVVSGFTLPSASRSSQSVTGTAVISGYIVQAYGAGAFTVNYEYQYTHVYLRLARSSSKVISVYIETFDAYQTMMADAIYLGRVTCTADVYPAGTVSTVSDRRSEGRVVWGGFVRTAASTISVLNNGSNNWTVTCADDDVTVTFLTAYTRAPFIWGTTAYTSHSATQAIWLNTTQDLNYYFCGIG